MTAQVIPMVWNRRECSEQEPWQAPYLEFLSGRLEEMVNRNPMEKLSDITSALFSAKTEILGELTLTLIKKRFGHLIGQEQCPCPRCQKILNRRGLHKRHLETMVGDFELERPYFYCVVCGMGFYPLDAALGLSPSTKQHDVQEVAAWLATEVPYDVASEAIERCTGIKFGPSSIHECVNKIAQGLDPGAVCPTRAEVEEKIARFSEGRRWRPVMMLSVDGANAPVRPEPSPRKGTRGKGDYKEVKGLRLYLVDGQRIEHLVSWHQIGSDQELAAALRAIKEAGLVPEERVRLCVVADGAAWIWNRVKEIFPKAREVLDYFHCSEHLHELAAAQYGKGTIKGLEWVHATLLRLFLKQERHVIAGIKRMKPASTEAAKLIQSTASYLKKHSKRLDYGGARRGGYHIGSGAMESANKLICHTRLKRPGAWWYPTNANNVLRLRCAKYNNAFARVMQRHRDKDCRRLPNQGTDQGVQQPHDLS
jgi:hypothetical protein